MSFPAPIYVCGPTASGKTALALDLAREHDGEIVNADAFQLFRGLDVLTAAPGPEERAAVPHHLYAAIDPSTTFDAQAYVELARPVIEDVQARGRTPVVTGGSGLYLKFLTHGASPLPPGDAILRAEFDARELDDLVGELTALDPVEAARTNLKNRRYVSRALEVCRITGGRVSELRDGWEQATRDRADRLHGFFIQRPRPDLHDRIARRTRAMLEGGAIEEVAATPQASDTCRKAIGYREIQELIAGTIDRATCEERINAATRQYAKRQETWFRRETWLKPILP